MSRPDGAPFAEILHTRRFDGGAVGSWKLSQEISLRSRLSITATDLDRTFGSQRIPSNQNTIFTEHALNGDTREHQWAVGVAFQHSALRVPAVPGVGYTYNVPGIFAQDEFSPLQWLKVAAAARVDSNNQYGTFASPRLSALLRQPGNPGACAPRWARALPRPRPSSKKLKRRGWGHSRPFAACMPNVR